MGENRSQCENNTAETYVYFPLLIVVRLVGLSDLVLQILVSL